MENQAPFTALGIDYGTRSVGVASGQSLTGSAMELATLRYSETRQSKKILMGELAKLVAEWKPKVIVVGWPLNMDGSESELCIEVRKFSNQLARMSGKPVEFIDERLTSHEAKSIRHQYDGFKDKPVDALAAKMLLESWFRQPPAPRV